MFRNQFNEFVKAIKSNNLANVDRKFKPEFLNKQDIDGYYPIHLVCIYNSLDTFKYFLKQNCDLELLDSHKYRPIYHAIKNGSAEIVKLLLGCRCYFNDGNEFLELAKTITKNKEDTIKILEKAIENRQIGIEMDLKCSFDCDHKFCLISFMMIEFDKSGVIACGSYGKVFKVVESKGGREFAVKKVTWKQVETDSLSCVKKDAKLLENNINDYKTILSHPHIIKYFGAIKEDYKLLIFMEYEDKGSIDDLIQNHYKEGLPYNQIIKYSMHILLALDYLHKNNIIHRDIKPENILLDKYDNCKLTDLGFSRLLETINSNTSNVKKNKKDIKPRRPAKTYCGTAHYMAPEIINGMPYLFPCDLWSLGATVIEMLTGKPPFYKEPNNIIIFKVGNGEKYHYESIKPTEKKLKRFIDQLLSKKPENRKTAEDLLKLDLFQNVI